MTVNTISSIAEFDTNGVTTNYPFFFKFFANEDLVVTYVDPLGVSSILTFGTHYTVNGAGSENGGSIVTTAALAGPGQLIVSREMQAFQQTSLRNQGKFLAETHEHVFDKLTMLVQQGFAIFKRALTRPFGRDYFFAENRRITAVKDPVDAQDAATKLWAQTYVGAVVGGMAGNPNLASNVFYLGPDGVPRVVQDMSGPGGAGLIGFDPAQIFPPNSIGSAIYYNRRKTVKSYGAVGDGVTDDTVAVKAAIAAAGPNGMVVFDEGGEYLIKETLVQPTSQQWLGQGGQRSARLKKGFNGDLVSMGSLGAISDLTLNNNGTNFTGRGIYVPSGFSQTIFRVRSVQSKGPSLEFAQDAGGGCNVVAFEGDTVDQLTVGAVKIAGDTGPHPRLFNGFWLSGGFLDLAGPGAGNGCSFSNFYIRNIKTLGPAVGGTALCHFVNGRVASISDTTVLSGSDITMASVAFSGAVILDNMQGFKAEACTFGAGITETSTSRFNSYSDQVKTFSPTWSQSTGPQPSIGNGSLTGKYTRQGYLVKFEMSLTVGSTTTFGNSASAWSFSLPVSGTQNSPQDFIAGQCFDVSATTDFIVNGQIGSGLNTLALSRNGSGVRDSFPIAWATGDTIKISIIYMAV